jgi:hypothetical protein
MSFLDVLPVCSTHQISARYNSKGSKYEGQNQTGVPEGFGIMWYENGDIYKGLFKDGMPHGFGEIFLENGHIFTGFFERGQKNRGQLCFGFGCVQKGKWNQKGLAVGAHIIKMADKEFSVFFDENGKPTNVLEREKYPTKAA